MGGRQKADPLVISVLKQTLQNLFKSYQVIPPVIAHGNLRMRGQAFVSFPNKEIADKARREVAGFPLYGKPMASWLSESLL